ncbi:MAG: RluA family pseudouridine synthase [Alcaligenaceae bacterium]|nr:RluA family pseudouridine synthase [Alcaligenaceae bacterium]
MPDTDIDKESSETPQPEEFELSFLEVPDRLDKVLARLMPQHSRSRLQGWIKGGHVQVNGLAANTRTKVGAGDRITVWAQIPPEALAFVPEAVAFEVVADSPDWVVVNKPAGLVTHPGAGNWHGTLLNGLLLRYPELERVARAGIVHRLDKDTSGLLVVARHEIAQTNLVRQLQAREVKREYRALVHGLVAGSGVVQRPIGRDARVPVRMSADRPVAPKDAITHYQAIRHGRTADGVPVSDIVCRLETGRTHQIRVHMAGLHHPLLGDALYGGRSVAGAQRQMLHARALSFRDPSSDQWVAFEIPVPQDFAQVLQEVIWTA